MRSPIPARWVAISVFIFASVLNYLDRQILATMADIWRTRPQFPFTYDDYGLLLSVFSIAYALSALLVGWFIDRVGLNRGAGLAVAIWALASFGTGASHSVHELLVWRALLGVSEASAIAAVTKAVAIYLLPPERAVGQAMSQLGLSLGAGIAPAFAVYFSYRYSWHWAFYAAGLLSLAWIPIWLLTSRSIPAVIRLRPATAGHSFDLLRDPRLWVLMIANMLGMAAYSLWANWAPTYLVHVHHLTPPEASHYTWIVPMTGYLGALLGGAISWRLVRSGRTPVAARKRACLISAVFLLATMAVPLMPNPALATVGMSFSYFWACAWSTNHYTLPIDIWGPGSAAFGGASQVFAYGVMQSIVSRPLGTVIERYGFAAVCVTFGVLPLLGYVLVHIFVRDDSGADSVTSDESIPAWQHSLSSDATVADAL
ncbi:MAG: MFS transporter [Bryobacterales bacterium]|nr:MFS transporter [Bryobacterales bacterium]